MNLPIDKIWHLAETEEENKITDFEINFWRTFYGFTRWQECCEKVANQSDLTGFELSILHIIRMKNRSKTLKELIHLLNRDDSSNITYSLKKLIKNGLVKKIPSDKHNKKTFSYEITKKGLKNTDAYTELRKKVLIKLFEKNLELDFDKLSKLLSEFTAIYEEAVNSL